MKKGILQGMLVAVLVLSFGCTPKIIPFLPHEDAGRGKRLAKLNRLDPKDVKVICCKQKANYVEIKFSSMPPSGVFKINSDVEYGFDRIPRFIHFTVPGGDVTALLSHPDCSSITKSGKMPIRCGKLPEDMKNSYSWDLKNWTMDDLKTIAPNIPAAWKRWIIDFEPSDGVVDWSVIAQFPKTVGWRFRKVCRWLNKTETKVFADFFVFIESDVELPSDFACDIIYLDKTAKISDVMRNQLLQKSKEHKNPNEFIDSEVFTF